MTPEFTDLDLAKAFESPIKQDYTTAIEFLHIRPDYSLMKFRKALETLCQRLCESASIASEANTLIESIDELATAQVINHSLKSAMHQLRIKCNAAVHSSKTDTSRLTSEQLKEAGDNKKNRDRLAVSEARNLMIKVLSQSMISLKLSSRVPKVIKAVIDDQHHREILFLASSSTDIETKMKAGMLFESMAEAQFETFSLITPSDLIYQEQSLLKCAAAQYEAAFKLSSQIDQDLDAVRKLGEETYTYRHGNTEALYRYGRLAAAGILGDEECNKGHKALKKAADRNHSEAAAEFGRIQYYDMQNYPLALEYCKKAIKNDIPLGHRILFLYYSDGQACDVQPEKALEHLNKAVDLGCSEALGWKGSLYNEGKFLPEDKTKAKELLEEAIKQGCTWSQRYYHTVFNNLVERFEKQFKEMAQEITKAVEKNKAKPFRRPDKTPVNAPCPCGSGDKYKKCCGSIKPKNYLIQ